MKRSATQLDAGGPWNLRGIHYQLLTSLREVGDAVRILDATDEGAELSSVTMVIEPRGGGDSRISAAGRRRIQQIKTSKNRWTLPRLVDGPFRDLFRASSVDPTATALEFITNGGLDAQAEGLRALLESFSEGSVSPGILARGESESYPLPWFQPQRGSPRQSTLADLVDHLVQRLCRNEEAGSPDDAQLREWIGRFLGRLSLRVDLTFDDQKESCESFLRRYGIAPESVDGAIDQIVGYLLRRGKEGNQMITFAELAIEKGLAKRDLSQWPLLCRLSREQLLADLTRPRPGYVAARDVRQSDPLTLELVRQFATSDSAGPLMPASAPGLAASVTSPPIVVWGRIGRGKTWLLARAATQLVQVPAASVLIWLSSEQDPQVDLNAAARKFSHQIWGRENALSIEILAERVRKHVDVTPGVPWLVLFVDGVQSASYLDRLLRLPCTEFGVLPVVAVNDQLGRNFAESHGLSPLEAPGFDAGEVVRFLKLHTPRAQGLPPADVRKLLQTPAFCELYTAVKGIGSSWQPEDEYQLVDRFWRDRVAGPYPQAADVLARLAFTRMSAAASTTGRPQTAEQSWTVAELKASGLSPRELDDLEQADILTRDGWSRAYSFALERLLQWAAAEGALRAIQAKSLTAEQLVDVTLSVLTSECEAGWTFGYVPADFLWLLLDPNLLEGIGSIAEAILAGLEVTHDFHQRESWLATLGRRVVPALFKRLQEVQSSHARYTYRNALNQIEGIEVAELATQLLGEPKLELQEVGVQLLERREHPAALDLLWALYKSWWNAADSNRARSRGRQREPSLVHVALAEQALRRSVHDQQQWLERRLLESTDLGGPRAVLLFLLAASRDGEKIWLKHKDTLRDRLDKTRQRGFASCILTFLDREEVPWLRSKINDPRDFVASAARAALAVLDPDTTLASVDPAVEFDLALGREWWLRPAWAINPEAVRRFFRELVAASDDPARTVWGYTGFELWWPAEVLDALVDTVRREVAEIRSGHVEPNRDPLFGPLSRLSNCRTLEQLKHLWEVGPSGLDSDLAGWLLSKGPNDDSWERVSEGEAVGVQKMIAGDGMNRVGTSYLDRAKTWTGGKEGLELCVRAAGPMEISTIRQRALDPTRSAAPMATDYPVLQMLCTVALAYLEDYEGFAQSVVRWGLQLPPDLVYYLDDHRRAPQLIETARGALEQGSLTPGAILLLGLHGGEEAVTLLRERVKSLLGDDRDLEVAWLAALDVSGDRTQDTMESFIRRLRGADDLISFSAWRALLRRVDDPRAQEALLSIVDEERPDAPRRIGLLLENETLRQPVAKRLWPRRHQSSFLFHFGHHLDSFAALGTAEVREFLLERATATDPRFPDARISAIRGLAQIDREAALAMALACREEPRHRQNGVWAGLMVEIGGSDAFPHLRDELAAARTIAALFGVGEALRAGRHTAILSEWLADQDSRVREGACYAVCAQAYEPSLESTVTRCCSDAQEDVRAAAQTALDYLRRDLEVSRVIDGLRSESEPGRCWALLDSALAMGYPGIQAAFGGEGWFYELIRDCRYYEQRYCIEHLKKRREQLAKELERKSKRFRQGS